MLKLRKLLSQLVMATVVMGALIPHAFAEAYTVNGKPLNLLGYITQGVAYRISPK